MPRRLAPHRPDLICLAALLSAIALLVWNRVAFDIWIARHDNLTAYLPWYTYLGERLKSGEIPGWNPYMFSGTPFAGDPQSGWMYFPAMIPFTLFDPTTAIWVKLAIELVAAGLATYALIRIIGYSSIAALAGSSLYVFGPLSFQTSHCCTVRSHVGAWLPLALLGIEIALRAETRWIRFAAIALGAFGYSQILAGWLGQGALNATLIIGAFTIARAIGLAESESTWRSRLHQVVRGATVALALGIFGAALNAAALWPRLVVNGETNLSAANYGDLPLGYEYPPYAASELVQSLIADSFIDRRMTIPAAGLVLILFALIVAPRAPAVRFFAGLTTVSLLLAMSLPPLYQVFSVIPFWEILHDHYPAQVTTAIMIGPAVLVAAAIDALQKPIARTRATLAVILTAALLTAALIWIDSLPDDPPGITAPAVIMVITGLVVLATLVLRKPAVARVAGGAVVTLILIESFGLELIGSVTSYDPVPGWEQQWSPNQQLADATDLYATPTDPTGAGAFLQHQLEVNGPFRFAGYGGITWPDQRQSNIPYAVRRAQPEVAAMLVNGRSIFLHLYDMQGYNPIQLSRYTDYVLALNSVPQDYHLANLRPQGIGSPLLDALNVRYILVDARIPADREDVLALSHGQPPVFATPLVRVYENPTVLPHAWLVHDVIPTTRDNAQIQISDPAFDPGQTAFVEADSIAIQPASGQPESVTISRYDPEQIELQATTSTDAFLVVSEIHESGWTAKVDGQEVEIIPTNVALRGISLPAGTHSIVFTYSPSSLRFGLVVSLIAHAMLAVLLVGWFVRSWRSAGSLTPPRSTRFPAQASGVP